MLIGKRTFGNARQYPSIATTIHRRVAIPRTAESGDGDLRQNLLINW